MGASAFRALLRWTQTQCSRKKNPRRKVTLPVLGVLATGDRREQSGSNCSYGDHDSAQAKVLNSSPSGVLAGQQRFWRITEWPAFACFDNQTHRICRAVKASALKERRFQIGSDWKTPPIIVLERSLRHHRVVKATYRVAAGAPNERRNRLVLFVVGAFGAGFGAPECFSKS